MSYSRWSSSYWYTFWESPGKRIENYDTATFCICSFDGNITFTAKKLREQFENCLNEVRLKDVGVRDDEMDELAVYMIRFLNDVDEEYLK